VDEIMKVQPHGPYNLAGGCYGGLVAFQMALKLRELGESVGIVALIDTRNFAYGRSLPIAKLIWVNLRFFLNRTFHHIKILRRMKHRERGIYLSNRFRVFLRFARNMILFATGKQGPWMQTADPALDVEFGEDRKDLGAVLNRVRDASLSAARKYLPKPYDGPLIVFRAKIRNDDPYRDEALGWRPVALGGVTAFTIDGDHASIFRHPDVAGIAQKLDAALLRAFSEQQRPAASEATIERNRQQEVRIQP
jgi:pimeloyl-ACP methyl ester carboxylesterase